MTFGTLIGRIWAGVANTIQTLEQRRWLATLTVVAIAVSCFAASLKISGPKLSWDSMDYAQCARQVAEGEGFTSKLIVGELTDGATGDGNLAGIWRNTLRSPLAVYAIAASFRLFGVSDLSVCYWAGAFYVATCWLLLTAFAPLFGFDIAFLSAVAFAVSRCGLTYARAGLSENAAMFFLLLAFVLLQGKLSFVRGALAGIVFGGSSLNRPIALVWAAGAVLFILLYREIAGRRFIVAAGVLSGVAAVTALAKFGFGWNSGHSAFALNLAFSVGDPREAFASPLAFVLSHFAAFLRKFLVQFGRPLVYLFQFGDVSILSGIAPFGLLMCLDEKQRRGRWLMLAMLACNALTLSVLMSGDAFVGPLRYFDVFAPLALPWAVQLLVWFGSALPQSTRRGFWALVMLALIGSALLSIRDPFPAVRTPAIFAYMRATVPQGEVIAASSAANAPSVAWYADRRTVLVKPDAPSVLQTLRRQGLRTSWFMTGLNDPHPAGFEVVRSWEDGLTLWHVSSGTN